MTMRLDIVTNDAGENVRKEHARELGSGVVVAVYRLLKLAQMHNLSNQAFIQQLDSTYQIIGDYCLKSGQGVNFLFADKAVFVAGQLLKGSRQTYEQASELGKICEWLGGAEVIIAREVTREELHALAESVSAAMRAERNTFQSPTPRIRIRPVGDVLRGLEIEDLTQEQRIVRTYASAVVILRRFFEDLHNSRYILPRRIKRIAQSLVDLSDGNNAAFLGVTEARNANHDEAGRAVNSAILAVTIARQVTQDRPTLSQIAMAAMMHDVARPRAFAISASAMASMGANVGAMAPSLSEEQEDHMAAGAAAVLTALGRVNEPSITRTVVAFEALWLRRKRWLGALYQGLRPPTIHARIMWVARRYNDLMTPEPGLLPDTADVGIAQLSEELTDPTDKTVLRMLVAALGVVPVGTLVQLNTGEVGEVTRGTLSADEKPLVHVTMDAKGNNFAQPIDVDLARPAPGQPPRSVARILSIDGWKKLLEGKRKNSPGGDEHGALDYDEAPAWESNSPPAPAPAVAITPAGPAPKRQVQTAFNDGGDRATAPVPREMSIDINADAFTVPPPAVPFPSSLVPGGEARPTAPVPAGDHGNSEPVSSSGVSVGTSPSMVGAHLDWERHHAPPFTPTEPPQNTEERTVFQASAIDSPVVERPLPRMPEPTARGDLASTPLAHVLVYMLDHQLTGSVVFTEQNGTEHTVYFMRGVPGKAKLGFDFALLGELLSRAGALDEGQVDHYVGGARRLGVLLGEYLAGHDVVSRDTLAWALETQVLEKVSGLANLPPETTYAYYRDMNLLDTWGGELSLSDPLNAVLAVVRAWSDRARIKATLNRIGKHPLILSDEADLYGLILSEEEQSILDLIGSEKLQLNDLATRQVADDETISALVYTLAVTRQFAFKGQKKGPMAPRGSPLRAQQAGGGGGVNKALMQTNTDSIPVQQESVPAPAPAPAPAASRSAQKPAASPKAPPVERPAERPIERPPTASAQKAPSPKPGATAGARPVAGGTIQGLHPNQLEKLMASKSGPKPAPLPPQASPSRSNMQAAKPVAAPIKQTAAVVKAVPAPPVAASAASAGRVPVAGPPSVGRVPVPPASAGRVQAGIPAVGSQPGEKPRVPQIRPVGGGKVPQIRPIAPSIGKMLAAPVSKVAAAPVSKVAGAPASKIAVAGPALAPKVGPPPASQRMVAAPSSSQVTAPRPPPPALRRPQIPVEPEPTPIELDDNRGTVPPGADAEDGTLAFADAGAAEAELAIEAMTNFRLADTALQRNNLVDAEKLALKAVDADPNQPEYRVLLVWVQAMRANNNGAFESAIASITKLIDEDPSNERAFLYRGRFFKKLGRIEPALEDFAAVLDLNPSNREAQAEARALKKK